MADSASSDDETNGPETLSTVLVSSPPLPPSAPSKRPLEDATAASDNPPPKRARRKASDFGQVGGQFTGADPDEEPAPQAPPPLQNEHPDRPERPQDSSPAAAVVAAIPPEVVVIPETRCSFGSEMVARPMDPTNIRELVSAREEQVEASTADAQAARVNDGNEGTTPSAGDSVETAAVGGGGQVVRGFRYEGNEIDPAISDVPILLLGQKRTSKDKFYCLHEAMRRENMTFLVATLKDEDGGLIYPLKCNLHEVVYNKQETLRDLIHERWVGDPSSIVTFVKSCLQVSQTRPNGSGTNVCLYLRVDAEVVAGLDGEAAACARFGELKEGAGCSDVGLVIALDESTVKKINQCSEAASFLHPDVVASVSAPKGNKKRYVRLDVFPLSGDKEEHPSFKFRLKAPSSKERAPQKRKPVLVSSGGGGGVETETAAAADKATTASGAHAVQQTLFASRSLSSAPAPAKPPEPPTDGGATRPPQEATAPPSALVVHSSEEIHNATEDEKAVWLDAGSALNAIGVQRPTLPRFPTTVLLKVDPKKISMQPWGDGEVVLLIQP